ncbi:AAA domain-containing protein [Streptomyces sp. NPDC002514]|uniref:AAA domain-containing protein n=1 Tax=Streptomyces sp. NPDC001270 TaxID=3364554 RepID=UPI00368DE989
MPRGRPCGRRTWSDVTGGQATRPPRGSSWVNSAEAERVEDCVRDLLAYLPPKVTIGVVTPFEELRDRLSAYVPDRLRVGTVHPFQGGECDGRDLLSRRDQRNE